MIPEQENITRIVSHILDVFVESECVIHQHFIQV